MSPAVKAAAEAMIDLLDELARAIGAGVDLDLDVVERVRDRLALLTRPERRLMREMVRGVFREDVIPDDDELDAMKQSRRDQRN